MMDPFNPSDRERKVKVTSTWQDLGLGSPAANAARLANGKAKPRLVLYDTLRHKTYCIVIGSFCSYRVSNGVDINGMS